MTELFPFHLVESLQVAARDLIFAGGETIGAAIQHVILYISLHADVQRKIQAEIDQVIGRDRLPAYADKKRYSYWLTKLALRFRSSSCGCELIFMIFLA